MFKFLRAKRRFAADLAFAVVLGLFYWSFRWKLPNIGPEVDKLFLAAYIFLGVGILILYLASDMNPKLASIVHVGLFPFLNLAFLFVKWMPDAVSSVGEVRTLSLGMLVYVLMLMAYFNIQLLVHRKEPEPEEIRKFRSVGS